MSDFNSGSIRSRLLLAVCACSAGLLAGWWLFADRDGAGSGTDKGSIHSTPALQSRARAGPANDKPTPAGDHSPGDLEKNALRLASFGPRVFQAGTGFLDHDFLEKLGLTQAKISAVDKIYTDTLSHLIAAEKKHASIAPGVDGAPPSLVISSIEGEAKEITALMQKQIVSELEGPAGQLLAQSLAGSYLFAPCIEGTERRISVTKLGGVTSAGVEETDEIWETVTYKNGRTQRSTIGRDYLEQRYGEFAGELLKATAAP